MLKSLKDLLRYLSLLDRALLSQSENLELNLKEAQKIFGYFDKSYLIDLFKFLFTGNEKSNKYL